MILWLIFRPVALLAAWYVKRHQRAVMDWRKVNDPEWRAITDLHFHSAEMRGGALYVNAESKAVAYIANLCAAMLRANDAANYVQMDMFSPEHERPIRFTVQWAWGESPAEQNARLRKELAALQAVRATEGKEGT